MKFLRLLAVSLFVLIVGASTTVAQEFDYRSYPKLDFSFEELQLDLVIDPEEGSIDGSASYGAMANINGADSLVLQAAHMEIRAVQVQGSEATYNLRNDSLIISLEEPPEAGESLELSVDYKTIPRFGVLKNDRNTFWSSRLPLSNKHWFPVIDHPRVSFNFSVAMTVPAGYQAVSNGVKLDEEVLDMNRVRYRYKTRNRIPSTSVVFAAGKFTRQETSFGIKRITVNSETGMLTDSQNQQLLSEAYEVLGNVEQRLGMEFPYERLHIIVVNDHFWETKTWGASTVFLYNNGGNLYTQLRRAIYAQWFGVYQREEQWSDADAINLMQAALDAELVDSVQTLTYEDNPVLEGPSVYDVFGNDNWNRIRSNFSNLEQPFKNTVTQHISELLGEGGGVYGFREYGRFWYQKNGQPIFELNFKESESIEQTETDSVLYRVDFRETGGANIRLTFQALQGSFEELVTLPLVQISPERVDTLEVTFTGARDSVSIQVPPMIQNVKILSSNRPNLTLQEYKPASYLIYQLRNGTTVQERAEAAQRLGYHSDNPDLQLAIRDFMREALDPKIRAPLIASFGDITAGASGTEQVFLDALQSENYEVQQAALFVLQNYQGNTQVEQAVREFALSTDSLSFFKDATRVFFSVADSTVFNSFVSEVVKADTAGQKAIFAIQELANAGNIERALRQAEFYISDVYEYPVRAKALQVLLQHDRSPETWTAKVPELLADNDPRIRYLSLQGIKNIQGIDYEELLGVIVQDEYDQRVYQLMVSLLGNG